MISARKAAWAPIWVFTLVFLGVLMMTIFMIFFANEGVEDAELMLIVFKIASIGLGSIPIILVVVLIDKDLGRKWSLSLLILSLVSSMLLCKIFTMTLFVTFVTNVFVTILIGYGIYQRKV